MDFRDSNARLNRTCAFYHPDIECEQLGVCYCSAYPIGLILELRILKDKLMNFRLLGCATIAFGIFSYFEPVDCGTLAESIKKDSKKTDESEKESESTEDEGSIDSNDSSSENDLNPTSSKPDFDKSSDTESKNKADGTLTPPVVEAVANSERKPSAAPQKPKKEIKGDPVVAKIGRIKEFRRSDVLKVLNNLPAQLTSGIDHDRLFQMCLDQLISSVLMVEQAKKAGMEKTKEYMEALDAAKNDLLARSFLMKEVMPKADNESVLKARYAKYVVDFKAVKETQIFHIVVASEKEGNEIVAKLDKGADFKKLAKEKSLAPSKDKGGEEGYVAISVLPDPIKGTLEKLEKNGYTKKPLEAGGAWHIFKLGDTRDSTHKSYEEIKDSLKQVIVQEEVMKLIARLMKQFNVSKFNEDGSTITVEQSPEGTNPAKSANIRPAQKSASTSSKPVSSAKSSKKS